MNIKLLTISTILSLCIILGFDKLSYGVNKINQDNISELQILNYLPRDNKTLFISNAKSSKIISDLRKSYNTIEQDKFDLIKNSIFAYLGLDLGTNKLEDIYNNELAITTYNNKEKDKDDVLLIFKIREKKDLDDILNFPNKIDKPDQLIKIVRENKLNYLKYIYRTDDNYIIASSNKKIIFNSLEARETNKNPSTKNKFFKGLLNNLKNEHNVLLTNNFKANELLKDENYQFTKDDYLLTLFKRIEKGIILKTYLLNNAKNLNILSYSKINKEDILEKKNYKISIYNNLLNSSNYLDTIKTNNFENNIFEELNAKLKNNALLLISENNWVIIFDKSKLSIDKFELFDDFNKNTLENNNNIYTIYSKDTLEKEDNIIKQSFYKKIFSIQSENIIFISNYLIKEEDIDLISKGYIDFKGDNHAKYFLNKKINLKNPYSIKPKNISYIDDINYFLNSLFSVSVMEFKALIKQSIPERIPFYYTEANLKIF